MAINTTLESASTTAASNGPAGSDQRTLADDGLRQYLAFIKALKTLAVLASATTVTPPSTANAFSVTGTTAITTIASTNSWDGRDILFIFAGILTLTNGSNLILPGSANITTAAGDAALLVQVASGQWRVVGYSRADGSLVVGTQTLTALTLTGNLSVQGNTTLGNASGDTLTIHPNAITWQNDPTHSANHTFTGNVTVNGNTTLGNAGTDTITTTGNVVVNQPTAGIALAVTGVTGSAAISSSYSNNGADNRWVVSNTSNTASSDARIIIAAAGSSAGDPYLVFEITSANTWAIGADNSNADNFTISASSGLGTSDRMAIVTDGRVFLHSIHNNASGAAGTTGMVASSSNATITATAVANCGSLTADAPQVVRVGNVVTVDGNIQLTTSGGAGVSVQVGLSLPIASNLAATNDLHGIATGPQAVSIAPTAASVAADTTNDRAQMQFINVSNAAIQYNYHYSYTVL